MINPHVPPPSFANLVCGEVPRAVVTRITDYGNRGNNLSSRELSTSHR
jgi:hypothetical protein